jgi:phosphoribosylformimino-5-aminoimidazole carboxamide ribotide isomerase
MYTEFSDEPVRLAQLWRRENAKCIHVTDIDSFRGSDDAETIEQVVAMQSAVDIPVQFVATLPTVDAYRRILERGVYRVAINTLAFTEPDAVSELLEQFGTSRVVFGLRAHNGDVDLGPGREQTTDEEYIRHVYAIGGRRLIYSETDWEGHLTGESIETIRRIAAAAPLRVTTAGGIAGPEHLWDVQRNAPSNVDSVVIGRALYENRFPCQAIWRMAEAAIEPALVYGQGAIDVQSSISVLAKPHSKPPSDDEQGNAKGIR